MKNVVIDVAVALFGVACFVGMALLFITALIGMLPEAHAADKQCVSNNGRVVCCTTIAGFPYCN
jgi:hypothetical protein